MRRFLLLRINALTFLCLLTFSSLLVEINLSRVGSQNLHVSNIQLNRDAVINPFPTTRTNSAMTITDDGDIFMFGGVTNNGVYSSDFYKYGHHGWSRILESKRSPSSRELSSLFSDNNGNIYMIGGKKFSNSIKEVLIFVPWKNEWEKLKFNYNELPSLIDQTIIFDKEALNFYFIGGNENGILNQDVFVLNTKELTIKRIENTGLKIHPTSNPIVHLFNKKLYVFGGYKQSGEFNDEIYYLDLDAQNSWNKLNLTYNDEKSKHSFKSNLVDIKAVGDQDKIYIFSPIANNLLKIQLSDYPTIEFVKQVNDFAVNMHGYNLSYQNQMLYFYGGSNNKEFMQTIISVSTVVPKPVVHLVAAQSPLTIENKNTSTEQNLKKKQPKEITNTTPANIIYKVTSDCLNLCSGHGECLNSACHCSNGFTGEDCSTSTSQTSFYRFISHNINYILGGAAITIVFLGVICFLKSKSQKSIL